MIDFMRKAKPKASPTVTRSVVLTKEVDAAILAIAAREERPLTYIISKAVREYIERDKAEHKAPPSAK